MIEFRNAEVADAELVRNIYALSLLGWIGAVLVLASTAISESLPEKTAPAAPKDPS